MARSRVENSSLHTQALRYFSTLNARGANKRVYRRTVERHAAKRISGFVQSTVVPLAIQATKPERHSCQTTSCQIYNGRLAPSLAPDVVVSRGLREVGDMLQTWRPHGDVSLTPVASSSPPAARLPVEHPAPELKKCDAGPQAFTTRRSTWLSGALPCSFGPITFTRPAGI